MACFDQFLTNINMVSGATHSSPLTKKVNFSKQPAKKHIRRVGAS